MENRPLFMQRRTLFVGLIALPLLLSACGGNDRTATPPPDPTATVSSSAVTLAATTTSPVDKVASLKNSTEALRVPSDRYYALASEAGFDYAKMWAEHPDEVTKAVTEARAAWKQASPLYEQVEGIVAGTPELSQYDVI